MTHRPAFAFAISTLLGLAPALCDADSVVFGITPFAGYRFGGQFDDPMTGDNVDIEESATFGVAIDAEYRPDEAIQVFYSRQSTDVRDTTPSFDLDIEYFQVGGVAAFPLEGGTDWVPYAVGTVGAVRFSPGRGGVDDETRFAMTLGGGVQHNFTPRLALRLEGRGYFTFFDTNADVFCVSNGGATCLLRTSGSLFWQVEAQAGLTFRF
jgi:opacity protein-like surface antigen